MQFRKFTSWLVLLNLIAFNLSALATPIVPSMADRSSAQTGCAHMTSATTHVATDTVDVMTSQGHTHEMPCCKHMHDDLTGSNASCGCKTGACGAVQVVIATNANFYTAVCSSSKVDAMSTVVPASRQGQRFLRPPIQ